MRGIIESILQKWRSFRFILLLWEHGVENAVRDPLTGLFLRFILKVVWEREVALANRYGRLVSIVLFDVDNLKDVNDSQGHLAGDRLLEKIGILLSTQCRGEDTPVRWGGDEFVVVLPETGREGAEEFAERVIHEALSLGIGISFGIGTLHLQPRRERREDAEDLLSAIMDVADKDMYLQKRSKSQ